MVENKKYNCKYQNFSVAPMFQHPEALDCISLRQQLLTVESNVGQTNTHTHMQTHDYMGAVFMSFNVWMHIWEHVM